MQVSFERWPATIEHGFDGADALAGVCAVSGRPVPSGGHAAPAGAEFLLVGRLAQLIEPDSTNGNPMFAPGCLRDNDSLLVWLVGRLPRALLRLALRLAVVRSALIARERLMPPIPVPLSREIASVRLQERLSVTIPGKPGQSAAVNGEGVVSLNAEINVPALEAAERRYRRIFGDPPNPRMRLGFLVVCDRVHAAWMPQPALRPRSRAVVEIGAPAVDVWRPLLVAGTSEVRTLALSLPYRLSLAEGTELASGLTQALCVTVSPEHDHDRNAALIVLTPMVSPVDKPLGAVKVRSVVVEIPSNSPPIEEMSVQRHMGGVWAEIIERRNTITADRFRWQTWFTEPVALRTGESLVLRIRCRNESIPLWERGGATTVVATCSYTNTLAGISSCQVVGAFGHVKAGRMAVQEDRLITFTTKVDFTGHDFLYTYVTTRQLDVNIAFQPNRTFAQIFADRLTESQILIRRVLESQLTSYEGRATPFECNLYGRVEKSMASPDIHVRIQSEQHPFVEITVSGKVCSDAERADLEDIADDIARVGGELAAAAAAAPRSATVARNDENGEVADHARLAQIENKLDRILERLDQRGETGR